MKTRSVWTREEEILAFDLYCKMPFGKIHHANPDIIRLSEKINRTPSAVSMKMCNFASFDPALQARGVTGLKNASKLDEQIWNEFNDNWDGLALEAEAIKVKYNMGTGNLDEIDIPPGADKKRLVKQRVNQDFFRRTVLASYNYSCCVTGFNIAELLIASHIKPWKNSDSGKEKTNPCNGLCLNPFHDKAFDLGFITVGSDYRLAVSKRIKELYGTEIVKNIFQKYEGKRIELPDKFMPDKKFLEYHNNYIFEKA